jgi:hypothetical protein
MPYSSKTISKTKRYEVKSKLFSFVILVRSVIDEHTLIRIGSKLPVDEDLSNNFLTFLVLEEIFKILRKNPKTERVDLAKLQENILSKAIIIVSTLNNCASSRLSSLVGEVDLVIIDEGKNESVYV